MDVELSDAERNLILVALWQMKLSSGKVRAEAADLSADELAKGLEIAGRIDQVAYKLGGKAGLVYGLGEPPE